MSEDLNDIKEFFENRKNIEYYRRYQAMQDNDFCAAQIYDERIAHIMYGLELIEHFRKEVRMQRDEH